MQSRGLPEDGRARMHRWHIRRRSGGEGPGGLSASFAISAIAGIATLVPSCGDGAVEPTPADPPRATTVTVEPASAELTSLGETVVFRATITDQYGAAFPGTVAWSSSDESVFTVDAGGTVTAVTNGGGTLTAAFQSLSGAAAVEVAQAPASLETVSGADQTADLDATLTEPVAVRVTDAGGSSVAGATVVFTPADEHGIVDPAEAVTDSAGLAQTVWTLGSAVGTQTLTAAAANVSLAITAHTINPDRAPLVALYEATDGPNWVNNENWLTDAPLGEWYGVDTDATGRVIRLHLSRREEGAELTGNGLLGSIPPELGNLANLEELNLYSNGLTGTIPPELGNLANLKELVLAENQLVGVIPPTLGGLTKLEELALQANVLTDAIPPELGRLTELKILSLKENDLTGPVPTELGGLVNLSFLDLGWNNLTGPIPPWVINLAELTYLSLRINDFTGPIPAELGNLTNLRDLLLDENNLSGPIPPELGNLHRMRLLFLQVNSLTGPIPPELGSLTNLEGLHLAANNLTGLIPSELGNLERLDRISLGGNLLTGSFPLTFARLPNLGFVECQRTEGVCLPATDEFREWISRIEARGGRVDVPFCDGIDKQALRALYEAANGSGWTRSDNWLEDEDLDRWHGVRTDSTGRVSGLDLSGNGLSGHVPGALEQLINLRELQIGDNALSGQLPLSLVSLALEEFEYGGTSLCVADNADFQTWLNGIPRHIGTGMQCPPLTEQEILQSLYRNTGGHRWRQRAGWLSDAALGDWHGVDTDADGRVVRLQLGYNGLSGSLPVELGELSQLRDLDLGVNDISGSIPPELGDLGRLESLSLRSNRLRGDIPAELGQLSQLRMLDLGLNRLSGSVPSALAGLDRLEHLDLRGNRLGGEIPRDLARLANLTRLNLGNNFLSGPVPPELGGLSGLEWLELGENQLSGGIPSELAGLGAIKSIGLADNHLTGPLPQWLATLNSLTALNLSGNRLTGPIPGELGSLANLLELRFSRNDLSGSIPAELGALGGLSVLDFADNTLSGSIPAELGGLASLDTLELANNKLSAGIPAELGSLPSIGMLDLSDNDLSGPLPAELGHAATLEGLDLRGNRLSGALPPEFANLTVLRSLILADNPGLAGPLPASITALARLELLLAGGTRLCRPADARFDAWFGAMAGYLARCREGSEVYLTQTVQSWGDPVPLLAGESAVLRVFVTAPRDANVVMPEVKATFYVNGAERHSVRIAAGTQTIPHEVTEGDLDLSANAEIPDWVIVPGLEMVIEVDPERRLDPALGVSKRIPESGRMAVDVRQVAPFDLTLIPILPESFADPRVVRAVAEMAADPDGHDVLRGARTLLPIAGIAVTAREPVTVSTSQSSTILPLVEAIRVMEGGSGYWMGVGPHATSGGVAYRGERSSVSGPSPRTVAHELGHNLSLRHAPCGSPSSVDPWFPGSGGSIGAWGFDLERHALVSPQTPDVMSYCTHGGYWISDYFFNKALNHRLAEDGGAAVALAAEPDPIRSLLVWGGRDQDGVPYLDPAFVVDAVPSLPIAGGDYTIKGATADGTAVFSYAFDMPAIGDAEGEETSFVFALPVQAEWADLASITLSGPGGSATLDETTDQPMAILRDPRTGQVRGFLSDLPPATQTAADAVGQGTGQGMEVLFSRGIPYRDAWRR